MTAEKVLEIARRELGTTESPAGSNRTKYGKWYGLDGYAWCMMFVQWCFHQAGAAELLPKRTAGCGDLMNAAKRTDQWVTKDFRPGDVVIYDFPGGKATDHTGIIERVTASGVVAIEGNTSRSGSQSNGGQVCRKTRPFSQIRGAVRPKFEEEKCMDNKPTTAHEDGVEWCLENGIIKGDASGNLKIKQYLTREQLCTMLYRYHLKFGKEAH